ncbi:MAG: hypothetical protein HZA24_05335 [Nitrospirae bacterium]|nr:hypothetical protein [Nitrospirota bacterium]
MKRNGVAKGVVVGAALGGLLLSGCGGGGGGGGVLGAITGLEVPSQVSVVSAVDNPASPKPSAFKAAVNGLSKAYDAVDTAYTTDPVDTWVHDPSMQPLDLVNEILCMMAQTRAADMVNQGAYIALIDSAACQQGSSKQDGSAGQSSGGGKSTQYEKWVIDSARASDAAPQIVHLWIPEDDGPGGQTGMIQVETTINEGMSASKPFGDFVLNFAFMFGGASSGGGTLMTVPAAAGEAAFTFFEQEGTRQANPADYTPGSQFNQMVVSVEMDAAGAQGVARTSMVAEGNWGGGTFQEGGAFAVAFDAAHMKRAQGADLAQVAAGTYSGEACLSRTTFDTSAWRYDLYHAADGTFNGQAVLGGDRVVVNSGFPFTYDNAGTDVYGHVGYWGMWVEDQSLVIPHGATITKRDHRANTSTPYTVFRAPGKLTRRVANTLPVAKLRGEGMNYWGEVDPGTGPRFAQWVVRYFTNALDGVPTDGFYVLAEQTGWDQNGPVTSPLGSPVDVTPPANQFLGLWSDSLGGAVNYTGGSSNVTFYAEEFVGGDDPVFASGALTLNCFERCLKPNVGQSDVNAGWSGVYLPNATDVNTGVTTYTIDPADMTLKLGTAPVTLAAGVDLTGTENSWGINTGEMVTADVKAAMTNTWDLWNPATVAVSYRWESGPNNWNQYTAVVDGGGNFASFDKPIQFAYEHATANDANGDATYNGRNVRLNYGGNGDLWGIPSQSDANGRWYPLFTIADGTPMGPTGTEFVVKAREKEQAMAVVPNGDCAALTLDAPAAGLPSAAAGVPAIGTAPVVTDAPAVIGGELQVTL